MEVIIVRHGKTNGNKEKRFAGGRTDHPVCESGIETIKKRSYDQVEQVYSSPMTRCLQTSYYAFGDKAPKIIEEFREYDFGDIEGMNHEELKDNKDYQIYLESKGLIPPPGAESMEEFAIRVMKGLKEAILDGKEHGYTKIACTVHGGVIMAMMSNVAPNVRKFYEWDVDNGEGFILQVDEEKWAKGECYGSIIGGIDSRIYS